MVLNAANEIAVEAFLDGKLGFTSIPVVIDRAMNGHAVGERLNLGNRAQGRQLGAHLRPRASRRVRIDDLEDFSPLTTLLAFLFVLGVLIFVHELGHFLAARRHGVRVLTFSLGFGPKILKVTRGDTEYCVSAIPLGGYVKMAGENPEDPRSGQPDEFLSKTKWQRFQILFAGPAMNILLAVVVLPFVLSQGAQVFAYLDQPPVVGAVAAGFTCGARRYPAQRSHPDGGGPRGPHLGRSANRDQHEAQS